MSRYIIAATLVAAAAFAAWETPVNMGDTLNTADNEWFPFISRDGLYIIFCIFLHVRLLGRLGRKVEIEILLDDKAPTSVVTRRRIEHQDMLRKREQEARQHPLVQQAQLELGGKVKAVRLEPNSDETE